MKPSGMGREQTVLEMAARFTAAATPSEDERSYLVVVEKGESVAHFPIGTEPLTVGRDEGRDVVLEDAQVSRLHLKVYLSDGCVMVEDLGSANGTYLDGKKLSGPVVLDEGRWLQVGSRLLKHERRSRREVERDDDLHRELDKARNYVQALLPTPVTSGPIRTDWVYRPSTQLSGDAFSYGRIDDTHVAAYLVDVAGHGVGAAMHSVTVLNVLRQRALPGADCRDPAQVLDSLNAMFPMDAHDGMYFTIWYGVYSLGDRQLAYASAGHPPGLLFSPHQPPLTLRTQAPMIGAAPEFRYAAQRVSVPAEATLFLFSDGAYEVTAPDGTQRSLQDFVPLLAAGEGELSGQAERIYREVCARAKPGPLEDDFSLLVVRFA